MNWQDSYKKKLVSVDEAAAAFKANDRIWYPPCGGAPVDLINAIARRAAELENVTMITGLILYPFEYLKKDYIGKIGHHTIFMGPYERRMLSEGNIEVTSYQFSTTDWLTANRIKPTVFIVDVTPPDENGFMSYGVMGTFNGAAAAKYADKIIVQVNNQASYVYGGRESFIHVDEVTLICEQDHKIAELPQPPVSDVEKQIAANIVKYIEDGSTIQLGLGGVANAVGFFLESLKDLGVHTEMFTDSMVTLAEKGVITGKHKTLHPGEISCSFGIGSQKLYDFMGRNPRLKTYPISYIAAEETIAKNEKFISINNALMCDLTGQVCSESLGFDQFSGTGGQLNFVRGAVLSPGGKSFLAFRSVAEKKDGSLVSRITAALPPGAVITTPRTDVQYVITEFGCADIRGKSISERVKALIAIAHPQFQDELKQEARKYGLLS
jgi:4-hydroxybutyrate CoA-transferase